MFTKITITISNNTTSLVAGILYTTFTTIITL